MIDKTDAMHLTSSNIENNLDFFRHHRRYLPKGREPKIVLENHTFA